MTLLSVEEYWSTSGDRDAVTSDVELVLELAQGLAEQALGREGLLEYGTHTETLPVWPEGIVYPTATPLDPETPGYLTADSLRVAVFGAPLVEGLTSYGYDGYGGYGYALHRADRPHQRVQVTYAGGYIAGSLPVALRVGLARFAQSLRTAPLGIFGQAPANAKSLTVGDVSVTLAVPIGGRVLPPDVAQLLRPYAARNTSPT